MDIETELKELKKEFNNHTHRGYDGSLGLDNLRYIVWRVLDNTSSQAVNTTYGGDFEFPFSGGILNVYAYVDTVGTTGTCDIDFNINTNTILSTKVTIDTGEKSSRTATTKPVLTNTGFVTGDILNIDIDVVHTTPAKGLTVVLEVTS